MADVYCKKQKKNLKDLDADAQIYAEVGDLSKNVKDHDSDARIYFGTTNICCKDREKSRFRHTNLRWSC